MKLLKHESEYYLVKVDKNRMAKDLPVGTLVYCLSEIAHGGEIRYSLPTDNCYGCQPIIASTKKYDSIELLEYTAVRRKGRNKNVDF